MRIPIYRSRQTSYQLRPGCEPAAWAVTSVESFEPIAETVEVRGEMRRVTEACSEVTAIVRTPPGTKLVTLEVPGSPVNPLVFAEIPDPKGKLPYLSRELPATLLAAARNRANGCELVADGQVEAAPEIERTVVVVPAAVESRGTPQVCEANQGSSDNQVEALADLAFAIGGWPEPEPEPTDDQVEVEPQTAEERIDAAIERATLKAWEEHQAMARPSSPKAGRSKRVASGQGSLF